MTNSKLKDSNIEWLGKIPRDWKVKPLYLFFFERKNKNNKGKEKNLLSLSYGKIIQKDINSTGGLLPQSYNTYNVIEAGDIIIRPTDLQNDKHSLRTAFSKEHGIITSAYIDLAPLKDTNSEYFHYVLHAYDIEKVFYNMGNGVRQGLNYSEFSKLKLPIPSSEEQKEIVNFLNNQVSQIDKLSKKIQQEITDLEEYRNSIIVKAVTKGLNPNVLMKDSGIPWIEKIPQQWNIEPIYLHFYQGKNKNNLGKEKNLLSLSYGKIIRKNINSVGGLLPSSYNTYNIVEAGDIIIRPTDLQNDKRSLRTGLVTEHGIITSAYLDLKPKTKNSSRYYHYLLHAYDIQKVFYNMGNGVRQGLNFSEFSKLKILVPNLKNQLAISDYLDNLNKKISKIILNKKSQLEKLNQYKQSIIYEYVTGKKQVPTEEGAKE